MNTNLKTSISENFKNTELGFLRIKRNLLIESYSDRETENYLRKVIIATPLENIDTKGKNHYLKCTKFGAILTINSHSLTVITAKQINAMHKILTIHSTDSLFCYNITCPCTPSKKMSAFLDFTINIGNY